MNIITDAKDERYLEICSNANDASVRDVKLLTQSLYAALARAEAAEEKLCRARARLDAGGIFPDWVRDVRANLSSTGPCFCAQRAEGLIRVAKEILANGYDQGRRIKLRASIAALREKQLLGD